MTNLLFAVLDNAERFQDAEAAQRARDLTIAWTRFKYSGPILEDSDLDRLLERAVNSGDHYCMIQPYGHLLAEVWRGNDDGDRDAISAIGHWVDAHEFLIAAEVPNKPRKLTDMGCLLVDLNRYDDAGRPSVSSLAAEENDELVCGLPAVISQFLICLDPAQPESWQAEQSGTVDPPADGFAGGIRDLTANLRSAVFVWNIESYDDVDQPAESFKPPLKALYTVSAGFKPNRILHSHGFDSNTRMVVFDYSPQGLKFRRMLREDWDGKDYPSFLRRLFRHLPSSEAHYLLWEGMTPENLDWNMVQQRWQEELEAWGGEDVLRDHWQKFRALDVEYLECNLLENNQLLLDRVRNEDNALIWWSNAFFSVYSNWNYSAAQRQAIYVDWIERLARKAPGLLLYGSDCHNISVNHFNAGEYCRWLRQALVQGMNELSPKGFNRVEMKY